MPDEGSSVPDHLINVNGILFFTANDGAHGVELWKTDGTAERTVVVKDIHQGDGSHPSSVINVNGTLYSSPTTAFTAKSFGEATAPSTAR